MQPETPVWMSLKIVFLDISDKNKSQAEVNVKSPSNSIFYSLTTTSVLQSLSFSYFLTPLNFNKNTTK